MSIKPLVALVGRPNTGKSTLFNRIVGRRIAVTDEIPGTTRDRLQAEAEWRSVKFNVVDTGGIEVYQAKGTRDTSPLAEGSIDFVPQIKAQAQLAIQEADVVVMVVDAVQGITAADEEVAEILRRTNKPIIIAANKADNLKRDNDVFEFYALGIGEVLGISAIHGLGIGDLLDAMFNAMQETRPEFDQPEEDKNLKLAIVGRPNVGKSSMLNRLIGEERVIVSPIAGTTRDAIDEKISWHGNEITLIDTAGIRRRGKVEPGVEKYSVLRAMKSIERADVALLVLDAVDGITEQDEHIAGYVLEAHKSVVIVVNKWDALEKDNDTMMNFTELVRNRFNFLPYAPIVFVSAKTGQRIHTVLETAVRAWESRSTRIPTNALNNLLRDAIGKHAPPNKGTKRLKIFFATQVAIEPPVFLFHVNDTRLVHFSYERYLENQIRENFPFEGTPIRLSFRPRDGALEDG